MKSPEEWMALLLFCITSMSAPTMPAVGAGTGGLDSEWSDTWRHKQTRTGGVRSLCVDLCVGQIKDPSELIRLWEHSLGDITPLV